MLQTEIISLATRYPPYSILTVAHDGFSGSVIGYYLTLEGKPGLVLQQEGTRVVHVYSTKWFEPKSIASPWARG